MRFCDVNSLLVDSATDGLVLEGTGGCGWDSVLLDGWELVVEGEKREDDVGVVEDGVGLVEDGVGVAIAEGVTVTAEKKC